MPFYELLLVVRPMPKNEVVGCLKKAAEVVWKENGAIKKIQYLGIKKLPFALPSKDQTSKVTEGSYFLYHMSIGSNKMRNLKPELRLNLDIVNFNWSLKSESDIPEDYECTLEKELLSPFYRESIKPLLEEKNVKAEVRR